MSIGSVGALNALAYGLVGTFLVIGDAVSADIGVADGLNDALAASFGVLATCSWLVVAVNMLALGTRVSVSVIHKITGVDPESS